MSSNLNLLTVVKLTTLILVSNLLPYTTSFGQDIALSLQDLTQLLYVENSPVSETEYPDCPVPKGIFRFISSQSETIRFSEPPVQGEFYYILRLEYGKNFSNKLIEIKDGSSYEFDYDRFGYPTTISVKRVCHRLGEPFVYHSEWTKVREIHHSRSVSDTICDLFNGADVVFNEEDSTYTISSTWQNRGWITTSFVLNIEFCNEQDTQITILSFPTVITSNQSICLMSLILKYQGEGSLWHNCDTINIFKGSPDYQWDSNCDGNHPEIKIQDSTLINTLEGEEYFNIAGFNVEILEVDDLSGIGLLTLPFQNKKILIEFNNLNVNEDLQVVSMAGSTITAVVNGNINIPTGSLSLGSELCIATQDKSDWNENGINSETGQIWDPNGFDQSGQYIKVPPYPGYQEGDPYDPNFDPCGFNAAGIHFQTLIAFNPDGCSRDSLTNDTPPQICELDCVPYYWLQEDDPTNEGLIFYDSISSNLSSKVDSLLLVIEEDYTILLNNKADECNAIACQMRVIVDEQELDSTVIFGQNSKYINSGLSEEFAKAPQPSLIHDQRNAAIVNLENLHVNLYKCDLQRKSLDNLSQYIADLITGVDREELNEFLERKIKSFTAEEVGLYQNHQNWLLKLKSLIEEFIQESTNSGSIGLLDNDLDTRSKLKYNYHPRSFTLRPIPFSLIGSYQLSEIINLNIAQMLGGGDANVLPLEIIVNLEGSEVKIVITDIGFNTQYLTVDAYFIYNLPNGGEQLVFNCRDIQFSPNGFIDKANLILESDVRIKLFNVAHLILDAEHTSVEWNCNGFEKMNVVGYIEFCNNVLVPLDSLTQEPNPESEDRVKAYFQTSITKLDGFYIGLSMESFAVAGVNNVRFEVDSAVLDMSTILSPGTSFPLGYTNEHSQLGPDNLPYVLPFWKGFYLQHLNVTVAAGVGSNNDDITIDLYDAVIDDKGFSGRVVVGYSILPLSTSNLGGWAFSIDSFALHFLFNQLVGGSFMGLIQVPIFKGDCNASNEVDEADCFNYSVQFVDGDGLQFSISPKSEMCVDVWSARVILDSNTVIHAHKTSYDFLIEANLTGVIAFNNSVAEIPDSIRFEEVRLRNQAPYFSPGRWKVPKLTVDFEGFGVTIEKALLDTVKNEPGKAALSFVGGIEISSDFSLKAQASISVIGDLVVNGGRQKWIFDEIRIHGVHVETEIKGTHIEGGLLFFKNEEDFGSGFKAELDVKFAKLDVTARAMGIFGEMESGWQYFNVDALIEFNPGLPLMGPLEINGLGGGLSYHMISSNELQGLPEEMDIENDSLSILQMPLGQTLTGTFYEPHLASKIGLKLILAGILRDSTICSYNAIFEIQFGSNGLDNISLKGNVKIMDGFDMSLQPFLPSLSVDIGPFTVYEWSPPPLIESSIKGYFQIKFVTGENASLSGLFALYMNAGTQNDTILYGKAVAELYIGNEEWYLNVGRLNNDPNGRVEVTLDVAFLVAKVQAYLNIGTGIPPMPDPPKQIKDLFGNISSPDASLGWGTGFAFGLAVDVDLDIPIIIGSIKLNAGFGFDLSVKRYEKVTCANTDSELGINGWYTTGQAYLYVIGKVELLGANLIDLSAGVLVQTGFPNPTWVSGRLKLKYKIIFIKGNISAKIAVGTPCIPEGEDGEELPPIIYNVLPRDNSTKVDVLSSIHVGFNVPMDKTLSYTEGENTIQYSTKLDFTELKSSMGFTIETEYQYDEDNLHLELIPIYSLPANDSFTFTIRVKVFKNNVELTNLHGLERIVGFRTGEGLKEIPDANLNATYPVNGMVNFYENEYQLNKGYVILKRNQYELMQAASTNNLAVILSSQNERFLGSAIYITNQKMIEFPLPTEYLEAGEYYRVELGITENVISSSNEQLEPISYSEYVKIDPLWSASFRVSSYESFSEKIQAMENEMDLTNTMDFGEFFYDCIALPITISEPFDEIEVLPFKNTVLSGLNDNESTLMRIEFDTKTVSADSNYSEEWEWIDSVLTVYSDPIKDFGNYYFGNEGDDRFSDLRESVYLGPDCLSDPDFLHPPMFPEDFDNIQGVAAIQYFLEPAQMEGLESATGSPLEPFDSNIANEQYLIINTPRYLSGLTENGKITAQALINIAVINCLSLEGTRTNETGPCDPIKLGIHNDLIKLAGFNLFAPDPPTTFKIPITFTYNLPGIDFTSSIHNLVYTITIDW